MSAWTVIDHREVPSGGLASITFSSIPQTYTDLVLVYSIRNTSASASGQISINGVTTNRTRRQLLGSGSTATSVSEGWDHLAARSDYTASTFNNTIAYFPNYTGSTNKSYSVDTVNENNATAADAAIVAGLWSVTDAITSLAISQNSGNLAQYSSATLYGVLKGSSGGVVVS